MSAPAHPGADAANAASKPAERPRPSPRGWRDLWQLPTLLVGLGLLVAGFFTVYTPSDPPDLDAALTGAQALADKGEPAEALRALNEQVLPFLDAHATRDQQARFHVQRAAAILNGQAAAGQNVPENHQRAIDEYQLAEKLIEGGLSPQQVATIAESLVELGRLPEAIARLKSLPESEGARKRRLLRRVIEAKLMRSPEDQQGALALLTDLATDPRADDGDRLWAVTRQAQLRLDAGFAEEALSHLLRGFQRLGELSGRSAADLYVLLARCYYELGRFDDAGRQLDRARSNIEEGDPLTGEILAMQGAIAQMHGDMEEARDLLTVAANEHPQGRLHLRALISLAEVESSLGNAQASLEAYGRVVSAMVRGGASPEAMRTVSKEAVTESLLRQQRERFERGDLSAALSFATLAESLHPGADVPPPVLMAVAETRRALGAQTLAPGAPPEAPPPDVSRLDPVTRVEGRAHYLEAASAYLRHARAMILADDTAYGNSLWLAGECYDRAGELDRAIEVYSEFIAGRPADSRRPAAELRVGFAHMARGDYAVASQFFDTLVRTAPKTGEAAQAMVPLAQCYQFDSNPDNDGEAERLLSGVIGGRSLEPEAVEFRNALVALGELKLRSGDLDEAIRRLTEAVERFPRDQDIDRLKYNLAEAYRRSAAEIEKGVGEAMPETQRRAAMQDREVRLRSAMDFYEQVRAALESRETSRLSALEQVQLRNASFFRADCAFDLGDFDAAIRLYDAAAQRYSSDPSSLVAMIQIVNSYVAKGAMREARTANQRARQRLAQLPESVFDSGDLPLDRKRLEQWLESSARLSEPAPGAGGPTKSAEAGDAGQ